MMEEDLNSWICVIRSCLITSKEPLTPFEINRDTKYLEGRDIPFKQLKFSSLEEMLKIVPGLQMFKDGGQTYVQVIPTQKTAHIAKMVSLQKQKKKPKKNNNSYRKRKENLNQHVKQMNQNNTKWPNNLNHQWETPPENLKLQKNRQMMKSLINQPSAQGGSDKVFKQESQLETSMYQHSYPILAQQQTSRPDYKSVQPQFNKWQNKLQFNEAFAPGSHRNDNRQLDNWQVHSQGSDTKQTYRKEHRSRKQRFEPYQYQGLQRWRTLEPPVRDFFDNVGNLQNYGNNHNAGYLYQNQWYYNQYYYNKPYEYNFHYNRCPQNNDFPFKQSQTSEYYTVKPPQQYFATAPYYNYYYYMF